MTIVYGGAHWDLEEDGVRVHLVGEEPKVVALDALPLPVARVLRSLGFQPSACPARRSNLGRMTLTAVRRETPEGRWELVSAPPHPALRAHVRPYSGFAEPTA